MDGENKSSGSGKRPFGRNTALENNAAGTGAATNEKENSTDGSVPSSMGGSNSTGAAAAGATAAAAVPNDVNIRFEAIKVILSSKSSIDPRDAFKNVDDDIKGPLAKVSKLLKSNLTTGRKNPE